jgi:hypothetical protein
MAPELGLRTAFQPAQHGQHYHGKERRAHGKHKLTDGYGNPNSGR